MERRRYDDLDTLRTRLQRDYDHPHAPRTHWKLYRAYTRWLLDGAKTTTIRYEPGHIDVPAAAAMPLLVTTPDGSLDPTEIGHVRCTAVTVTPFDALTTLDAVRDGFDSRDALRDALQDIYGTIPGDHPVTIYHLDPDRDALRDAFQAHVED